MSRWEPGATDRLRQAAVQLYGERGYDHTTVADIAARAGLTERTFFRHFADKREVLFGGADALQQLVVGAVENAPPDTTPFEAVARGVRDAADSFAGRHPQSSQRQAVITAHRELQARELVKMASLAAALADALRRRGTGEPAASLAAEAGTAVFRVAFERWVAGPEAHTLRRHVDQALAELRAVTAGD